MKKGSEFFMESYPYTLKHGTGVMMKLDNTRLLLSFKKKQCREDLETLLKEMDLILEGIDEKKEVKLNRPIQTINHTEHQFWIRSQSGKPIDNLYSTIKKVFESKELEWIGPVYQLPNTDGREGLLCPLPNVLMIKPKEDININIVSDKYHLKEVPEKSKYLGAYRYYIIDHPNEYHAYHLQNLLLKNEPKLVQEARFENMPLLVPYAVQPNDPLFVDQWNMTQIEAGGAGFTGWDISTGHNNVVICVLDSGCDLTHPDLNFSTPGINLGTMTGNGSPTGNHGTACAGIAAAVYNNALGVAGVAGNCQIMPLAFQNLTESEVASGIRYAADNGAQVISMSFGNNGWDPAIIDPAIQYAFNENVVMCVATHNHNLNNITYPATNPLVIACGASDQIDNRKTPTSPDGSNWGSNFGAQISVVAPGVRIPTTDRQGNLGYNTLNGVDGDYCINDSLFGGTSAATPHVAGLAALIRSEYPTLTNVEVRNIIEQTAEKVGTVPYNDTQGYHNGTWNQEMGYGRINVLRSLDYADVMIKDWPGDTGTDPSIPPQGNFWDFSDIAIRITDDNVFEPNDPIKSKNVERGQTNYLYIRVTNNGPREARNVVVNARITPYVGLQFVYPTDWTTIDATHVSPTPMTATFGTIPPGDSVIAKFTISPTQVEDLWGWKNNNQWHPCLLASVNADNDYAFDTANLTWGNHVVRRNNLAQRNLSVIDVLSNTSVAFPLLAGNRYNTERFMDIVVDRSLIPKEMKVLLSLDDDGKAFPRVDLTPTVSTQDNNGVVFLEKTRIETTFCDYRGVLTLERGSRFDCVGSSKIGNVRVEGGEIILRNNKRFVEIKESIVVIRMEKQPNQLYPLALHTQIPANTEKEQQYVMKISQKNEKQETVGGATVVYVANRG